MSEPDAAGESCAIHEIQAEYALGNDLLIHLIADPVATGLLTLIWPCRLDETEFVELAGKLLGSHAGGFVFSDNRGGSDMVTFENWAGLEIARSGFDPGNRCYFMKGETLQLGYYPPGKVDDQTAYMVYRQPITHLTLHVFRLLDHTGLPTVQQHASDIFSWLQEQLTSPRR